MNKTIIAALAAGTAFIATPALAQNATGTVNITGSVAGKCAVVNSSNTAVGDFTSTVALGELAQSDGRMKPTATLSSLFNAGGTGGSLMTFRVSCTTAAPKVSVLATAIALDPIASAPSGYANTINFDATATVALASGGPTAVKDDSAVAGATVATMGSYLGAGNNIVITGDNFRTATTTDILMAGGYKGQVVVTVSPS